MLVFRSLPHRQLRNNNSLAAIAFASLLPHRQLRNYTSLLVQTCNSLLPHRQLRKSS
ncbi:hypothetical protein PMAG_b0575 [Pseudoalteromonas mariniglutinosa NCIMB 1770]|nr:hypothetical protein [Pseudoalteromonas mariniglutinosa NCIMB 1770]